MNPETIYSPPKESVRALLAGIVDYAGLFPPSQISMSEAVANYAAYRNDDYSWMLGRFVVPGARLDEFLECADEFLDQSSVNNWRLSVLAGEDVHETLRQIDEFNNSNAARVLCDTIEVKANSISKIENTANALPAYLTAYFELPPVENLDELILALAMYHQRAKIRTGGTTADAFPSTAEIIHFMQMCLAAKVPFKATAGLHHPMRCFKNLTYEKDAPQGMMHGFLNLFLTAGFARQGFKPDILEELMEDEFAEGFDFSDGGVTWHQDYFLPTIQLKKLREENIVSFGSCSFEEPIEDLQSLEIL